MIPILPPTTTLHSSAILLAIAERLTALELAVDARSAPAEQIRQALDDILAIYGVTAQTGEVIGQQRDQIQALAEAMERFHRRLVEHDRLAADAREEIRALLEQLHAGALV